MTKDKQYKLGEFLVKNLISNLKKISLTRSLGEEIGTVGSGGDKTKFADLYIEDEITKLIKEVSVRDDLRIVLVTEETGLVEIGDKSKEGVFIILDPLDGSNNIRAHMTPSPSVGLGLAIGSLKRLSEKNNFDAIEVVFAADVFNERIYSCIEGERPRVEGFGEIRISPITNLSEALIGISFDYQASKCTYVLNKVEEIMLSKKCQRRIGSSILDFAKVACGEYDAFLTLGGKMGFYDLAAVKLIVESAGGVFEIISGSTDFCLIKEIVEKKDLSLLSSVKYEVLASANMDIHNSIKSLLK